MDEELAECVTTERERQSRQRDACDRFTWRKDGEIFLLPAAGVFYNTTSVFTSMQDVFEI